MCSVPRISCPTRVRAATSNCRAGWHPWRPSVRSPGTAERGGRCPRIPQPEAPWAWFRASEGESDYAQGASFEVAPGVLFALWTGRSEHTVPGTPRTCEAGLMVPGPASAVDETFTSWVSKGVHVVEEPHDEVFGRTFVITDPDGNLIRVAPVD